MTGDMLEINIILFKGYMVLLGAFLIINSYCNSKIKQMQNRRKSYNLLSKVIEVDLSKHELEQLKFLMYQNGINDVNRYFRNVLFR